MTNDTTNTIKDNPQTRWIVVTGLDGSGKTTLVKNLADYYRNEKNLRVATDRFPHDKYLVHELLEKSKDAYTDRLLFALDNRIFGTELKEMMDSKKYDDIITQRGFLDSFVHGSVQGFSYAWINELNRVNDLPKCDVMIHMVCNAGVAYSRICDDPDADKFEYPDYIEKQECETRKAYDEVTSGRNPNFEHFKNAQNIYIDTTQMSTSEVFSFAIKKLENTNLI